jgi:hypothetical protein
MENRKKECYRLDGKWRVVRKFTAGGDATEQNTTLFEDYVVEFATGGTLIETHDGEVTTVTYRFDAEAGTIETLPATDSTQSNPIFGGGGAIFRVVPLNDREIYLRRPHSVEAEGEFETILLKKVALFKDSSR